MMKYEYMDMTLKLRLKCPSGGILDRQDRKKSSPSSVQSNVKVLLSVFFDYNGVVHYELLPEGRTVNKKI